MKDIFNFAEKPYNLRNNSTLKEDSIVQYIWAGTDTISSLAPNT